MIIMDGGRGCSLFIVVSLLVEHTYQHVYYTSSLFAPKNEAPKELRMMNFCLKW